MSTQENPFAGQGPVLLDIGGEIGALVVTMPAELEGIEVEIRPTGDHRPDDEHHRHGEGHGHSHAEDHDHDGQHLLHVAVVPRPAAGIEVHSLVFPELVEGEYELYQRPAGPVELSVTITGGQVTEATWPDPS